MAAAFARLHGGAEVDVYSAGSTPADRVNPRAVAALAERGIELGALSPRAVADLPPLLFDLVIGMGCGDDCPIVRTRERRDWDLEDPRDMGEAAYRDVRDDIERRVLALLQELSIPAPSTASP
jgi:protein-tyrosine-phosphatase